MGKTLLIIIAIIVGAAGLFLTACGAVLLIMDPNVFGIVFIPGVLLLWLAYWLIKRARLQSAATTPKDP